jgi:molybdopterin converting factor small subunit
LRIRVLAFARLRELLGGSQHVLDVPSGATTADVWTALVQRCGSLAELADSTRLARNGRLVMHREELLEGDEVALLPPVGGG